MRSLKTIAKYCNIVRQMAAQYVLWPQLLTVVDVVFIPTELV